MLIMDRASFYINKKFVRVYYSKNILPFQLLFYIIHLLQPLDVVCFQPLKHSKAVDDIIWDGDYKFSKLEFLAQITSIYLQAFKKNTIKEFFRKTGLISFNLEIVMQKLQDLLPSNIILDLPSISLTPIWITQVIFFTTFTIIYALTLYTAAFINTEYFFSSQKIM